MAYSARVLRDSIGPNGIRLTTVEVTFPRIVLAEANTHRVISKNSASSRAIPVEKMLARAEQDPFIPIYWGKNQKGMVADIELTLAEQDAAVAEWLRARDSAMAHARNLLQIGVHKQIANRLLEPFLWQTCLFTATEWTNFFNLRRDKNAQPEIHRAADLIWDAMQASRPEELVPGDWHLPLVDDAVELLGQGFSMDDLVKICVGRACRISYLTHDGKRDPKADIDLCNQLQTNGHMSPFEHAAMCLLEHETQYSGNIKGWLSARKTIPGEAIFQPSPQVESDLKSV